MKRTAIVGVVVIAVVLVGTLLALNTLNPLPTNTDTDTTTTTTEPTTTEPEGPQVPEGFVSIVELINATFDGVGFADAPEENSTLESTLTAIEILSELDLLSGEDIQGVLNLTADAIKDTQDPMGGFRDPDEIWPDVRRTALSLRILNLMGRLDSNTENKARAYLADQFLGGLSFDGLITDGVLSKNYWGIMGALEMDQIRTVTDFNTLTIANNVFSYGDSVPSPPTPVLYSNETYWDYPSAFVDKSFGTRTMILEVFEMIIRHSEEYPTIIPLLVDINSTILNIIDTYNSTTGIFNGGFTQSSKMFRLLVSMGALDDMFFENSTGEARLNLFVSYVNSTIHPPTDTCALGLSIIELHSVVSSNAIVDRWYLYHMDEVVR